MDGAAETAAVPDAGTEQPAEAASSTEETLFHEDTATADGDIDMNMAFPIPIGRHTGATLRNLINLIYSRGALINKATGGHFHVDELALRFMRQYWKPELHLCRDGKFVVVQLNDGTEPE